VGLGPGWGWGWIGAAFGPLEQAKKRVRDLNGQIAGQIDPRRGRGGSCSDFAGRQRTWVEGSLEKVGKALRV